MKLKLKIIALILVQSFLLLDLACAGSVEITSNTNDCLSPQVSISQQGLTSAFEFLQQKASEISRAQRYESSYKDITVDENKGIFLSLFKKIKTITSYLREKWLYLAGVLTFFGSGTVFAAGPGFIEQLNYKLYGIPLLAAAAAIVYVATASIILLGDWILSKAVKIKSESGKRTLSGSFVGLIIGGSIIFFNNAILEILWRNILIIPAIFLGIAWFAFKAVKEYKESVYFGIPSSKLEDDALKENISYLKFMKFAELPFDLAIVVIWSLIPRVNQFFMIIPLFIAAVRFVTLTEARDEFKLIEKHITKKYDTPENFLKQHFEGIDFSKVSEKDKRRKLFKIIAESAPPIVALSVDRRMGLNFHDKECYNAEKFFPWFSPILNVIHRLSNWGKKKATEPKAVTNGVKLPEPVSSKARTGRWTDYYLRPSINYIHRPVVKTAARNTPASLLKADASLKLSKLKFSPAVQILSINSSI